MAGEWTVPPPLTAATSDDPLAKTSLYVSDLDPQVTDQELIVAFCYFGPLASVRVFRDLWSGHSLCYGFVNFKENSHASEALRVMNNTEIKGKTIRVRWSKTNRSLWNAGIGNQTKQRTGGSESNKAEREDPLKQKQDESFSDYLQRYRAYVDTSMYKTNVDIPVDCFEV